MNLTNIWGSFSYLSALFVAVYIVAMKLPRKKMFPLRLLCCTGVVILYKCCSDAFVYALPPDDTVTLLFRVLDSFLRIAYRCCPLASALNAISGPCCSVPLPVTVCST